MLHRFVFPHLINAVSKNKRRFREVSDRRRIPDESVTALIDYSGSAEGKR